MSNEKHSVSARMKFLGPCVGKPRFHGISRHLHNLPLVDEAVWIEDGRPRVAEFELDKHGFGLCKGIGVDADPRLSPKHRAAYVDEMAEYLKQFVGAEKVVVSNSTIRRSERSSRFRRDGTTVPGRFVHCDYSASHAGSEFWIHRLLPHEEATRRLGKRYSIYNLWRSLSDPPQDVPLAMCDARTLAPEDIVCADCIEEMDDDPALRFEIAVFRHNVKQRWYYFSAMLRHELLVFKGFDSDRCRASIVAHAAFDDPSCPADAPPRESIEVRALALFE